MKKITLFRKIILKVYYVRKYFFDNTRTRSLSTPLEDSNGIWHKLVARLVVLRDKHPPPDLPLSLWCCRFGNLLIGGSPFQIYSGSFYHHFVEKLSAPNIYADVKLDQFSPNIRRFIQSVKFNVNCVNHTQVH